MADVDSQFLRSLFDEEGSLHAGGRIALYRLHGLEGLLYVGISTCPLTRVRTHLREQPWGPYVIGIQIDYPDDAEEAERTAIWTEHPKHNIIFNGSNPPPLATPASRLRTELALERRRLEEFEAAVPESATHLRLITRGITAKQARIAKLVQQIQDADAVEATPRRSPDPTRRAKSPHQP